MSEIKDFQRELNAPFEVHEIEWRINRKGFKDANPWATAIPYITSRAVQDRLDSVFGIFGWQNEIKMVTEKGFLSGVSVKHNDGWITKWDGAEGSSANGMDLIKSGSSNALKRAAVLLGIGRYLYDLDEFFVESVVSDKWNHQFGNVYKDSKNQNKLVAWKTPNLPKWALPGFDIDLYIADMKKAVDLAELQAAWLLAERAARLHQDQTMIQLAIKTKNDMKAIFAQKSALSLSEDTRVISTWVDDQIKGFDLVPNKSSVESVFKALSVDLIKRALNTMVDIAPFQEKIKVKFDSRIEKLKQSEQ